MNNSHLKEQLWTCACRSVLYYRCITDVLLCSGFKRKVKLIGVHQVTMVNNGNATWETRSSTGCTKRTAVLGGGEEILSPEICSQTLLLSFSVSYWNYATSNFFCHKTSTQNILWHWLLATGGLIVSFTKPSASPQKSPCTAGQNCESSDSKPYSCTAATGLSYSTKVRSGGGIRGGKERVINTSEFWQHKVGLFFPSKSIEAFGQLLQ